MMPNQSWVAFTRWWCTQIIVLIPLAAVLTIVVAISPESQSAVVWLPVCWPPAAGKCVRCAAPSHVLEPGSLLHR